MAVIRNDKKFFLMTDLGLSYFVKLHDIKHLEKNSINIAVPTLMEVPITPMGYGVILIFERVIDFIHRGTLSC